MRLLIPVLIFILLTHLYATPSWESPTLHNGQLRIDGQLYKRMGLGMLSGSPEFKHGMVGDEWLAYQREAYKYKNGDYPANIAALMGGDENYIDAYNAGTVVQRRYRQFQ